MLRILLLPAALLLVPLAARGQQFPEPSPAGTKARAELIGHLLQAGVVKEVKHLKTGKTYLVVADAAKLQATVAAHRALLTPALRDTLIANWSTMSDEEVPCLVALLRAFGADRNDHRALAFAALFQGQAEAGQLRHAEALKACREAAVHFSRVPDPGWEAAAHNQIGQIYYDRSQLPDALKAFQKALALVEDLPGGDSRLVARCLHNIGSVLSDQGRHRDALKFLTRAIGMVEKQGAETADLAEVLNTLAGVYHVLADYDTALKTYQRALDIRKKVFGPEHPAVAKTLDNLGDVHFSLGAYGEALRHYRRARAIFQKTPGEGYPDTAINLSLIGKVHAQAGDFAAALDHFRRALAVMRTVYGNQNPFVAKSFADIGDVYLSQGEYGKALAHFKQALDIRREVFGERHHSIGVSFNRMGLAYSRLGQADKALEYYQLALTTFEGLYGPRHPEVAASLNNLGFIHEQMDELDLARDEFEKARAIFTKVHGENHPAVAACLDNLAGLHGRRGEYGKALELHLRARAILRRVYGRHHPEVAQSSYNIGVIYYYQKEYEKALEAFDDALPALFRVSPVNQKPPILVTPDRLRPLPLTSALLAWRATVLEKGLGGKPAAEDLRSCAKNYAVAALVLDRLRETRLQTEESKLLHGEQQFEVFPRFLGVCRRLYQQEGKGEDLEAAFDMAERGTARVYVESLGRARALALGGVNAELRTEEAVGRAELGRLEERLAEEENRPPDRHRPERVARLREERQALAERLGQLTARLERQYPNYAAAKYPKPCTPRQARDCLAKNEVALVYVLGDEASYVVLLEKEPGRGDRSNGLAVYRLPPAKEVAALVESLTDPERLKRPGEVRRLGADGYRLLVAPFADRIKGKDLVIVPAGGLCNLPFALLVEGADGLGGGRYLVEEHRLRYAPSLTALHLIRQWAGRRAQPARPLWALGDPVYDPSDPRARGRKGLTRPSQDALDEYARRPPGSAGRLAFQRLPFSGEELQEIKGILGAADEEVRVGLQASEAAVKEASRLGVLARARYVHFATHGILGLDDGRQPALVLGLVGNDGKADGGGANDGFLTLEEVTHLRLNADLVALSACRSGQGRLYNGEGVRGLARAFLYAGSRAVLCSLWAVADRETSGLMADFYRNLQADMPAPDALRAAQRKLIRAGKAPYYWAPFILVGE
jgi:tetratricopeptide (TPR) repeat protein